MGLLYLLNKAAKTRKYINYPFKKLGFPAVTWSQNLLIRACSSTTTNPISPNPSSQLSLSDPKVKEAEDWTTEDWDVDQNVTKIVREIFSDSTIEKEGRLCGGRMIKCNPENPTCVNVAKIAVELFNKHQVSGAHLTFLRLMEVSQRIMSGVGFYITLEGFDHGARAKRVYKARVHLEALGAKEWMLVSFEPLNGGMEVGGDDSSDELNLHPSV